MYLPRTLYPRYTRVANRDEPAPGAGPDPRYSKNDVAGYVQEMRRVVHVHNYWLSHYKQLCLLF